MANIEGKKAELYAELTAKVKEANRRIRAIKKAEVGKWAISNLENRLGSPVIDGLTKTGLVKRNKKMSIGQMRASLSATEKFLNSKTSTLEGIEETRQNAIKGLQKHVTTQKNPVTYEEAEALYRVFEDRDYNDVFEQIDSSELVNYLNEAIFENWDKDTFMGTIEKYNTINDVTLRNKLEQMYYKYVLKKE